MSWRVLMRRALVMCCLCFGLASTAQALTVRDIIELSRAGLGEEVLLALIDVDRGVYGIDAATLKQLKDAGVPERVIVALVRSGREPLPPVPPPPAPSDEVEARATPPQVVVIEHRTETAPREVMVPVPVFVPVTTAPLRLNRRHPGRAVIDHPYVPFQPGLPLSAFTTPPAPQPQPPVFWGHGGKLRPDAWVPDGYKPDTPRAPEKK